MLDSKGNKELFKLQSTIEILLEKMFQVHFNDDEKLKLYENII